MMTMTINAILKSGKKNMRLVRIDIKSQMAYLYEGRKMVDKTEIVLCENDEVGVVDDLHAAIEEYRTFDLDQLKEVK